MTRLGATDDGGLDGAIGAAVSRLVSLQGTDGAWRSRYGGPMFLTPMYVAGMYAGGQEVPAATRDGIIRHVRGVQCVDGGIGLHEEADGCMFTTALNYVALRILGVPSDDPDLAAMRGWIFRHGTPLGAASWGKFVLAVLNLYSYEGLNPIPPELWLLPRTAPLHPGRLWCHARQVYLPMAWLYGRRFAVPETDLIRDLRGELYEHPYEEIPFGEHLDTVAPSDNMVPVHPALRAAHAAMRAMETRHPASLRSRALDEILRHIDYEDRVTDFIDIGPVNSVLNAIVRHAAAPAAPETARAFGRLDDYLCETTDGVHFNGYNSTALWDTAFAFQALTQADAGWDGALALAHDYIDKNQVREDPPDHEAFHRHRSRGGWPFSDRVHGWPISDCTAEGLRCVLAAQTRARRPLSGERLQDAVELILSLQNRDGGWASYERTRGPAWLERLNPSQVFGDIMIDSSYPECSSACVQALAAAAPSLSPGLRKPVARAVRRGADYLRGAQRSDGGWYGSWGICFTYGTWFGVSGLRAAGLGADAAPIRRAAGFLVGHQNPDGGWGEHYSNCLTKRWRPGQASHAVQTAWSLLALMDAGLGDSAMVRRGIRHLLEAQRSDGDWPRDRMTGMFNQTTAIDYDNYRRIFPLMALARYRRIAVDAFTGGRV